TLKNGASIGVALVLVKLATIEKVPAGPKGTGVGSKEVDTEFNVTSELTMTGAWKTYAEPAFWNPSWSSRLAPMTSVPSPSATELPNSAPACASLAVSFCFWLHVEPLRLKTYADPESSPRSSSSALVATSVLPRTETAPPKPSPSAASLAASS